MNRTDKESSFPSIIAIAAFAMAFAMQIFITPKLFGTAIRVSLADILLPIIGLLSFREFLKNGLRFVCFELKFIWLWLFAMTAWMIISFINGIIVIGYIQTWALVNKLFGWFVLITFFTFGALVANKLSSEIKSRFFSFLLISACCLGAIDFWPYIQTLAGFSNYQRVEGFTGNPNAYGLLVVTILTVCLAWSSRQPLLSARYDLLCFSWLFFLLLISGSRSAWLGGFFGIIVLLVSGRLPILRLLFIMLIAGTLFGVLSFTEEIVSVVREALGYSLTERVTVPNYLHRGDVFFDSGIHHRMVLFENAIQLWVKSPIFGTGLGSFIDSELKEGRTATIHATTLWLLTETGLIGLAIFSGFALYCGRHFWCSRKQDAINDNFYIGGLAVLAIFISAAVGMEAMYQRHIWFFSGFALACSWRGMRSFD